MREQIREFILKNFLFGSSDERLGDEDSFLDQGVIDSTGVLELVQFLEERFGIVIDDAELLPENLDSINKLVAFLGRKTQQSPVADAAAQLP
ncbi:MAG: acyl carrier protein [Desulfobacteraceae bacterium]|nr:acyl carrier protein [Desulfobacteraceae bacterium]